MLDKISAGLDAIALNHPLDEQTQGLETEICRLADSF
jgi:hypothetical protein